MLMLDGMPLLTGVIIVSTANKCSSSSHDVVGYIGQNVTLKCTYEVKNNNPYEICWGRGDIPSSRCHKTIISTDGRAVKEGTRASSRYQLLGRLDEGDVSLTILNITESDAGRYGCRVEISGPWNDAKHHFNLIVKRGENVSVKHPADV